LSEPALLEVQGLTKSYADRSQGMFRPRRIEAVHDLSFSLARRASLAIVGESGSGKTTTARMILGLEAPSAGRMLFEGQPLPARPDARERRARARRIQIVFQNPHLSLDPKQTPRAAIEEILGLHAGLGRRARRERALDLLQSVGLGPREADLLPRRLSGGQAQRVAIARALAVEPLLLVLDEAVSALDVSVQAQILNLLADLRDSLGVAFLFISHDLAVVRQISDKVLVMYRGRAVEAGETGAVLCAPAHPYTQKLLASVPRPEAQWIASPATDDPETGCRFRSRCPHAFDRCREEPPLMETAPESRVRCWLAAGNTDRAGPLWREEARK
jgi:oligopeptide/dipeptide ABC transporter ATP-binding protein